MSLSVLPLALALLLAPAPAVPYIAQPPGPYCTVAAVLMAGAPAGLRLPLNDLARKVPVHADGVSWLDLRLALRPRALTLFVGRLTLAQLHGTLAAGVPVIVAVRGRGAGKHVWVVTGVVSGGLAVLDPADPARRTATPDELTAAWLGGEAALVVGAARPVGIPWAELERATHRYAAVEWARRAARNGTLDAHTLLLLDRAVEEDATLPELHVARARVLRALGRDDAARAAVETALRARVWTKSQAHSSARR